ncbi:MAG: anhydro-N-acetylmuramic acid kinase [Gammaproteobacteria bacterium]|nr:anhydro-N-acetylmuramic acid kinase [Gammaproteobacteria bacterium]MBI5619019.1 anhydro-N-acetylmuramic acid kinase [Gammaproteobacteria bacterium]
MPLFLGLISGTSMDGVDAALVDIDGAGIGPRAFHLHPYPATLRQRLERLVRADRPDSIGELGRLHSAVGRTFADAAVALLRKCGTPSSAVTAIGSHGQTIGHAPGGSEPFSLQIGDPSSIAHATRIVTVADFRAKDVAAGGQGAPLVPPFHEAFFRRPGESLAIVNIGGIANVTLLPAAPERPVLAFDCGPGNTLMDLWIQSARGQQRDDDGGFAAEGNVDPALLATLLTDPYFGLPPPKSTGRDYFNRAWLDAMLARHGNATRLPEATVQATLAALTARGVADAVSRLLPGCGAVAVCGGGAHNAHLLSELGRHLPGRTVETTLERGLDPDFVEATAFAWLAYRRLAGLPGNMPTVTGAAHPVILGGVYAPD